MRRLSILCSLILSFASSGVFASSEKLNIAMLVTSPEQIQVYSNLFSQFESTSDIEINVQFYSDINFKKHIRSWVELGTYDVLYWQGGKRLTDLIEKQEIIPLSEIIDVTYLRQQYQQSTIAAVSLHEQIYALPLGHYIWGFYYNKEVFEQFNITPPKTWSEFVKINDILKQSGIKPLVQATVDEWPVLAWLDYLSLNVGGIPYRNKLLSGEFGNSKHDKTLVDLFRYLVSEDLFFANQHPWNWEQPVVSVVRKQAAMTLSGQFVEDKIQNVANDVIGFFPFPTNGKVAREAEVAPLEVLVVPASSPKKQTSAELLKFLVDYTAIDSTAYKLGWLSVSNQPSQTISLSPRTHLAQQWLNAATKQVQYFDRDAPESTASIWSNAISKAITEADISYIESLSSAGFTQKSEDSIVEFDDEKLLSFSTLSGLRGTFFVSSVLHRVYEKLGYRFHVNRFDTSEAVINSLRLAADGDLVRAVALPELEKLAIKVPEPIITASIFLVGKKNSCPPLNNPVPEGKKLGYNSDAVVMQQLADKLSSSSSSNVILPSVWQAFEQEKLDYVLLFETDLHPIREKLSDYCLVKVKDQPVYHYLANKHADLVDEVTKTLKLFKQTDEYKTISREFGVTSLVPDSPQ